MTSGVALVTSSAPKTCELSHELKDKIDDSVEKEKFVHDDSKQQHMRSNKRSLCSITIGTPELTLKKSRSAVQRTHSPKSTATPIASPFRALRVKKVTPTLSGMKDMSRHLQTQGEDKANPYAFVALPTECTYELCSAISWSKKQSRCPEEISEREQCLRQRTYMSDCLCPCRIAAISRESSRSVKHATGTGIHVYLQHSNIQQIDTILEFPKKKYAIKQNPKAPYAFNESRYIFQRLADQFWPGPVHLMVSPQSSAPNGLLQSAINADTFIGFRCPSHPLAIRVLKQVRKDTSKPIVLVGSSIRRPGGAPTLRAKEVAAKVMESPSMCSKSRINILHGEERREIFAVPTCQFKDKWLSIWILHKKRTLVLTGNYGSDVLPRLRETLRGQNQKNRVINSILQQWKVADCRRNFKQNAAVSHEKKCGKSGET